MILIVQHCRTAVAALAHRSGHQLVDEGGNLVGAVVNLHGDVDLLDGAGGKAGSAPAFLDCHIQGRIGNPADGADAQDLIDHIIGVHRFGNRAIHQVIRFDVAAGVEAGLAAHHRRQPVEEAGHPAGQPAGIGSAHPGKLDRHEFAQGGNLILRQLPAVIGAGLQDRVAGTGIVAVGQHVVVGEDIEFIVLLHQAAQGAGSDVDMTDTHPARGRTEASGRILQGADHPDRINVGGHPLNARRYQVAGRQFRFGLLDIH